NYGATVLGGLANSINKLQQSTKTSSVSVAGQNIGKMAPGKATPGDPKGTDAPTGLVKKENKQDYGDKTFFHLQLVKGNVYLTADGSSARETVTIEKVTGNLKIDEFRNTN